MIYKRSSFIPLPVSRVFAFCASREGFLAHFPYPTKWVSGPDYWEKAGETLHFEFRFGPKWIDYIAEVTEFKRDVMFVDVMRKGPYKHFRHEHRFEARDGGTEYMDIIDCSLGMGSLLDEWIARPVTASTFVKRHNLLRKALATEP